MNKENEIIIIKSPSSIISRDMQKAILGGNVYEDPNYTEDPVYGSCMCLKGIYVGEPNPNVNCMCKKGTWKNIIANT